MEIEGELLVHRESWGEKKGTEEEREKQESSETGRNEGRRKTV